MGLKRHRPTAMHALSCLALTVLPIASVTVSATPIPDQFEAFAGGHSESAQRLGVIVPAHKGDLSRAVSSLERWPANCSPVTLENVDLVLYYAESVADEDAAAAVPTIAESAGRCFANTKIVYANLNEEEDVYPKGPSVQFYKMFLDQDVRPHLAEYDALAIIEWDVLVASDESFAELYKAAFGSTDEFWVKGSNLEGTNFHTTAAERDMWHVLGHINGNALYNNNDAAFIEFVEYTRARWDYRYPYDVALWATISDFPYSWPLWQRYSSKFVTTNLISNVGYEHVDHKSVADAVSTKTLFIHGSHVDDGNVATIKATSKRPSTGRRSLRGLQESTPAACETVCGGAASGLPSGTSTVCDVSCADGRFDGHLCGAGKSSKFGADCRLCYTDVNEARGAERALRANEDGNVEAKHVVMCDTLRPPEAEECSEKCSLKRDTVCDESCGSGRYGDYNCNWREHGAKCRYCFDDLDAARVADEVALRHKGRVVMCDTTEPPRPKIVELVAKAVEEKPVKPARKLQKWKDNQRWKDLDKWKGNDEDEPKWKTNMKWKNNRCDDGCEYTSQDGTKGRICDTTCKDGDPYGSLGCSAKQGLYGRYCRVCYNDQDKALDVDSSDDRAIMCSTGLPVTEYDSRRLSAVDSEAVAGAPRKLQKWKDNQRWKDLDKWKGNDEDEPKWKTNMKWKNNRCDDGCEYTSQDGTKGRICDTTCKDGDPYGSLGCSAKQGLYGRYCRVCYNDQDKALDVDSSDDRAIMCSTGLPVTEYDSRRLSGDQSTAVAGAPRKLQKWKDNQRWKDLDKWKGNDEDEPKWKTNMKWKNNRCDDGCEYTSQDGTKGRICDTTCKDGDPYGSLGCSAKQGLYGRYCRVCYNDQDKALDVDSSDDRAIMCSTGLPVTEYDSRRLSGVESHAVAGAPRKLQKWKDNQRWKDLDKWKGNDEDEPKWKTNMKWKNNRCDDGCEYTSQDGTKGRICDTTCKDGDPYGSLGCSAKQGLYGRYCRVCYNDQDKALDVDSSDDRAIMCSTGLPVTEYDSRRLSGVESKELAGASRKLQKWKDNQRWKDLDKWKGNDEDEPKWKTNMKWKNNRCDDGCEYTSQDGTKGRICDTTCKDGDPYGSLGCSAKQGLYGRYCRVCYNDQDKALDVDSSDDRAIMCSTGLPVTEYDSRRLSGVESKAVAGAPRKLQKWKDNQRWKDLDKWKGNDEDEPKWKTNMKWKNNRCDDGCEYTSQDGTKGRICDTTCKDGDPYGSLGCSAKQGLYGRYCRVCYNDQDKALDVDSSDDRAIMCSTGLPVTEYDSRRLSGVESKAVAGAPRKLQKWKDNQRWKDLDKWKGNDEDEPKWKTNMKWKNNRCDDGCEYTSQDGTKGRICDTTCKDGDPYGSLGCSAKQGLYGRYCRVCYNDQDKALDVDSSDDRAIMCSTGLPVTEYDSRRLSGVESKAVAGAPRKLQKWKDNQRWKDLDKWKGNDEDEPKWKTNMKWKNNRCDDGCVYTSQDGTKGRICDTTCKDGDPYGSLGCSAKQGLYGRYCRVCYNDQDKALDVDSSDDRAIMCSTGLPVTEYDSRRLSGVEPHAVAGAPRKLQKWKDNQRWKDLDKWKGNDEDEPKWKTNMKWKNNRCDDGCEYTSQDGTKGRICDTTCKDGDPYGRLGCSAKQGLYGRYCRVCYNDQDKALDVDSSDDRAIMCETGEPVDTYSRRQLLGEESLTAFAGGGLGEVDDADEFALFLAEAAKEPFTQDLARGNVCVFFAGGPDEVKQMDVSVQSVLDFVPGVRIAVAADVGTLEVYQRSLGRYPSVNVYGTQSVRSASLFADHFCGEGTAIIYYMRPGSVVSRTFTSKDTHSPRGDLLVVYGDARHDFHDAELARQTTEVLGFKAPSFTHGTELLLPVGINAELRAELISGLELDGEDEEDAAFRVIESFDNISVPQVLAALAYARNTPGVWFLNPQTWVTNHLFKTASIWDIPLVKPRFSCELNGPLRSSHADSELADILSRNVEFFQRGGSCESGSIAPEI